MDVLADPHPCAQDPCVDQEPLRSQDVSGLFAKEATRIRRLVRLSVSASDAVVEDACQVAWMRLVSNPSRVRATTATAWLVRVAVHEAMRGARRTGRDLSLDAFTEGPTAVTDRTVAAADEIAEQHHRLDAIDELPERQRRLVWLRGLGFTYREMAGETGDTVRTVERQLDRARLTLERSGVV
jgi:RNA polymerase sigma factor (sigma-70 family)